jgi:predicted Zn-dependent protease
VKKVLMMTAALSLAVFACKSSDENTRPTRKVGMSLEESRQIVQSLEAQQAKNSDKDPLRTPGSMDDLLNILKRDQIDLFPAGVAWAAKQGDPKAKALQAQIELAWGDAHLILAELFSDAANRLRSSVRLASRGGFLQDAAQKAKIDEMKKTIQQCETVGEALEALAAEHVSTGARIAQEVINANPDDYVGWRLAADFYRMRGEWPRFDEMVKKIEEKNPDSNGLLFLRGTAALERDGNVAESSSLLRQALSKDPAFTRAQAQLVLSRGSVEETFAELEKLRALAPNHQIVVWAGPPITAAYNARQEALKASQGKSHVPDSGGPTRAP